MVGSFFNLKRWRDAFAHSRKRVVAFLLSKPERGNRENARSTLTKLVFLRVLILSLILGLYAYDTLANGVSNNDRYAGLIVTTYAISLLNALWLRWTKRVLVVGYFQLATDVVLATAVNSLTASPAGIVLYLLVVIGGALVLSSHGAVMLAVLSSFSYAGLALGFIPASHSINATVHDILLVYVAFVSAALVTGYLARQLAIVGAIAQSHAKDLDALTKHQQQIFDDITEGIITVDLGSAITNINQAARAIIGLSEVAAEQFIGRPFASVLKDLGVENVDKILSSQASERGPSELLLKAGASSEEIRLSYTAKSMSDHAGNETGKIIIFSDVSHVRGMEERLRLHERMTELLAGSGQPSWSSSISGEDLQMIGESAIMKQIFALVNRVAGSDASVLVTGESGTGKELIAKAVHSRGPRKQKPFVAINCGAIPENLIESELFGHKKGSFTGAISDNPGLFRQANGGTLFLDEIGELPLLLQTKLLRVLQERKVRAVGDVHDVPVDVRVIAATNRDLKKEIAAGRFREDLYYRLNVVNILVPPLRERRDDIPPLVRYFIGKLCDPDQVLPRISPEALQLLMSHSFPGNIRELENIIERALVLGGQAILPEHLPSELRNSLTREVSTQPKVQGETQICILPVDLEGELERLERFYIFRALEQSGGIKKQAASLLGLNFRSFRYRLKKYGVGDTGDSSLDDNL